MNNSFIRYLDKMKKSILLGTLLLVFCSSQAQKKQINPDSLRGEPILAIFGGFEVDMGTVKYDDSVKVDIKFQNRGFGDLTISKIATYCTCTEVTYTESKVPPTEEGTITLTYTASKDILKGESHIWIHYNSMKSPMFISLSANVVMDK
jgi:hypothetical protein